ncbi:MAG TPA: xanthine dehydrogenase family protein subunit M [Chloroflexota bacterium]|nr:xanthine dehydrogenase family protein subunit M [Chloroflexota bacterium]
MAKFARPASLREALDLLASDPEARPLAGGTAIQILRRQGLLTPGVLVDLMGVPELRGIREANGRLRIGAMVTHREVEQSPQVMPLLRQTYRHVGNVRVRHTATVGGNLVHGDYRLDPPAALLVLGATLRLAGPRGTREIAVQDFFVDLLETALEPGELLVDVAIPLTHTTRSSAFVKFSSLAANDWPCVGVAAVLDWTPDGAVERVRLGVTAMAPTPLLVEVGDPEQAAAAVLEQVDPIPDVRGSVAYKRRVCAAVVRDAVDEARQAPREPARAA